MTMITPSYLGETIEYSSLHACRSTLEDPTFIKALQESLENFGLDRPNPATGSTVRAVRVSDVRASFARHYQPEVWAGKLADAQRQAFVRAKKAAASEGIAKKESWDGAEWLWQKDK